MPVITVDIGEIHKEQKLQLIKQLSYSAAEVTGIPLNAFTVVIHESGAFIISARISLPNFDGVL